MNTIDDIAAPATAPGGAIAIIRLSGPNALKIGNQVWHGRAPLSAERARMMLLGHAAGDHALAVYMKAPASYTGDDVVEFHCHGGAAVASALLSELLHHGCRMAEPGEFTFRAFANGKIDLTQAEAVADVVSAGSRDALTLAENQLSGVLGRRLTACYEECQALRSECEARLDFPDEDIPWSEEFPQRLAAWQKELDDLAATGHIGGLLRSGVAVALTGSPNVGKSTLFNLLSGTDRAIVSAIPGTTRDTIDVTAELAGIPLILTDTAGLRETPDEIERLGVDRSYRAARAAEVVFCVLDASAADLPAEAAAAIRLEGGKKLGIWNKMDLVHEDIALPELPFPSVRISAKDGTGRAELEASFRQLLLGGTARELPGVAVNARILAHLKEACDAAREAGLAFEATDYELAAWQLQRSGDELGCAIGRQVAPDVLDAVFRNFCIGK